MYVYICIHIPHPSHLLGTESCVRLCTVTPTLRIRYRLFQKRLLPPIVTRKPTQSPAKCWYISVWTRSLCTLLWASRVHYLPCMRAVCIHVVACTHVSGQRLPLQECASHMLISLICSGFGFMIGLVGHGSRPLPRAANLYFTVCLARLIP